MCFCVYMYIHICICSCMCIYICVWDIYVPIYVFVCVCMCFFVFFSINLTTSALFFLNVLICFTSWPVSSSSSFLVLSPYLASAPSPIKSHCFCSEKGRHHLGMNKAWSIKLKEDLSFKAGEGNPVWGVGSPKPARALEIALAPTARPLTSRPTT